MESSRRGFFATLLAPLVAKVMPHGPEPFKPSAGEVIWWIKPRSEGVTSMCLFHKARPLTGTTVQPSLLLHREILHRQWKPNGVQRLMLSKLTTPDGRF